MADHQTIEYIQSVIQSVLEHTSIQANIEYEDSLASGLVFNLHTRDAKLLIGHQGTTLYALEHLIHALVARNLASKGLERVFFSIDVDNYKKNRQYNIKQLIKNTVIDMKGSGKSASLPSMPKYERKFAHMYIQEQFPHIITTSDGVEPNRYIRLSI